MTVKDRYDTYLAGLKFDDGRGSLTPLYTGSEFKPIHNLYVDANDSNSTKDSVLGAESKYAGNKRIYGLLNNALTKDGQERKNYRGKYDFRYGLEIRNQGHEDPTILGFDLLMNTTDSPLFNECGDFLFDFFEQIPELEMRVELYDEFIKNLSKYFNKSGQINSVEGANLASFKSHYIKSVTGMSNLMENVNSFTADKKQFVKFGEDKITLKLYEDVELSIGYLAMLYKTLTWSKINGKQMIPDNLLRFDMDIIVSEIRNFNTVMNIMNTEGSSVEVKSDISDHVSRYIYRLYDCQFIFKTIAHDDVLNNGTMDFTGEYELDIIYKFSTMDMEKIDHTHEGEQFGYASSIKSVTNRNTKYEGDGSKPTDKVFVAGSGVNSLRASVYDLPGWGFDKANTIRFREHSNFDEYPRHTYHQYETLPQEDFVKEIEAGQITAGDEDEKANIINKLKSNAKNQLNDFKKEAKAATAKKVNGIVNGLVNDTIGKLRNQFGVRAISHPQNVYDEKGLKGIIKGNLQDFTNQSVGDILGGLQGSNGS